MPQSKQNLHVAVLQVAAMRDGVLNMQPTAAHSAAVFPELLAAIDQSVQLTLMGDPTVGHTLKSIAAEINELDSHAAEMKLLLIKQKELNSNVERMIREHEEWGRKFKQDVLRVQERLRKHIEATSYIKRTMLRINDEIVSSNAEEQARRGALRFI